MHERITRHGAWIVAAVCLLVALLTLYGGSTDLRPIAGDCLSYLKTASGIGRCVSTPAWAIGRFAAGGFTDEEKQELGFDGWTLQHAPLYLFPIGISQAVGVVRQERGSSRVSFWSSSGDCSMNWADASSAHLWVQQPVSSSSWIPSRSPTERRCWRR